MTYYFNSTNFPKFCTNDNSEMKYPPTNIIKYSEEQYALEFAVAGFSKDDIRVYTEKGMLVVEGKKEDDSDLEYIHKGISSRNFKKTFELADDVRVNSVRMKQGILTIWLDRVVPEEQKRKEFTINSDSKEFLQD